ISIIGKNSSDVDIITTETGTRVPEGMATGVATGGVLGGVTGLLAGVGAIALPGIGPLVVAGPNVVALTDVTLGAWAGGLVGGLVGLGFSEQEATEYNSYVSDGKILVLVDEGAATVTVIEDTFRKHGSLNTGLS
ncbi:MAG: low temperature-induced protein, partial [Gorillibacterium sp.]|nr:low temperature-induced protein [Gorillibacterium sp.]